MKGLAIINEDFVRMINSDKEKSNVKFKASEQSISDREIESANILKKIEEDLKILAPYGSTKLSELDENIKIIYLRTRKNIYSLKTDDKNYDAALLSLSKYFESEAKSGTLSSAFTGCLGNEDPCSMNCLGSVSSLEKGECEFSVKYLENDSLRTLHTSNEKGLIIYLDYTKDNIPKEKKSYLDNFIGENLKKYQDIILRYQGGKFFTYKYREVEKKSTINWKAIFLAFIIILLIIIISVILNKKELI